MRSLPEGIKLYLLTENDRGTDIYVFSRSIDSGYIRSFFTNEKCGVKESNQSMKDIKRVAKEGKLYRIISVTQLPGIEDSEYVPFFTDDMKPSECDLTVGTYLSVVDITRQV